eukprot:NODE_842_length_3576_cov_0.392867.p5 type:complete len:128 gc:universal NODE_842_length_3576_cov_0.392867:1261-1644(+)
MVEIHNSKMTHYYFVTRATVAVHLDIVVHHPPPRRPKKGTAIYKVNSNVNHNFQIPIQNADQSVIRVFVASIKAEIRTTMMILSCTVQMRIVAVLLGIVANQMHQIQKVQDIAIPMVISHVNPIIHH